MVKPSHLTLLAITLGLAACGEETIPYHPVPNVPVTIEFRETDLNYQQLQQQGWQYINNAGVRGIIIIKEGSVYRAFDRNCPYQPTQACARVNMHSSGLYLLDEDCCESTFDKQGQPTGGPAPVGLRQYTVTQENGWIYIYN